MRPSQQDIRLAPSGPRHIGYHDVRQNQKVKEQLQSNWSEAITQRTYVAVIEGRPEKDTDLIVSNLVENKHMQVYVTQDGDGKEAITRYRLLQTNNRYSLVELDLETGRKNQIRAQMQSIGHPIAGDSKYGAETNPAGRLMLHAPQALFHPSGNRRGDALRDTDPGEIHIDSKVIYQ